MAVFVQWPNAGATFNGQILTAYINPANPTSTQTNVEAFKGVRNGGNVTLTLSLPIYGVKTLTGTVANSVLLLTVPNTSGALSQKRLLSAPITSYVTQLNQLTATAAAAGSSAQNRQNAQASQQEQQAVTSDVATVQGDLSGLNQDANFTTDLAGVASALKTTQTDLATAQSDAQSSGQECPNTSPVSSDVSSVIADATQVGQSAASVESDVQGARSDISGLQSDFATLQSDEQTANDVPAGAPSSTTVNAAIAAGQSAISSAISTTNPEIQQALAYATSAISLFNQANQAGNCHLAAPGLPQGLSPIS